MHHHFKLVHSQLCLAALSVPFAKDQQL